MGERVKGTHRKVWNGSDLLAPGEYAYLPGVGWFANTPNDHLANLASHDCEYDKESDTLTISPSIKVSRRVDGKDEELWHGYLEAGFWREC